MAFTIVPIHGHFDHEWEVIIETGASDKLSAKVLSQHDAKGALHSVAYFSKTHTPAECNYVIYDKILMAIIKALEEWRPECAGTLQPLQLLTDHMNVQNNMTNKLLNRRWAH